MSANVDTTDRFYPFYSSYCNGQGDGTGAPLGMGKWGDGEWLPLCPTIYWRLGGYDVAWEIERPLPPKERPTAIPSRFLVRTSVLPS